MCWKYIKWFANDAHLSVCFNVTTSIYTFDCMLSRWKWSYLPLMSMRSNIRPLLVHHHTQFTFRWTKISCCMDIKISQNNARCDIPVSKITLPENDLDVAFYYHHPIYERFMVINTLRVCISFVVKRPKTWKTIN